MKVLTTSLTRAMGFFFRRSGMLSIPYRLDPPLQAAEKRVRKEREKRAARPWVSATYPGLIQACLEPRSSSRTCRIQGGEDDG